MINIYLQLGWSASRRAVLVTLLTVLAGQQGISAERPKPAIVPWPQKIALSEGEMPLTGDSRIVCGDQKLQPLAKILADEIAQVTGLRLAIGEGGAKAGDIELADDPQLKKEHYRLAVADRASVVGGDYNAVALGTATLLQAMRIDDGKVLLPRLQIDDHPFLEYCGVMFDIARKPYSIETLKQIVQVCRLYKIRFVQLHMTDENAWVFPSTAFPELGKHNTGSSAGPTPPKYTLEQLKDLVAYADARGVTFVPEFEMPGHSGQLLGTLPDIFAGKDKDGQIISLGMINVANEKAYEALDTLIGEICDVFRSSPYFHTGGDEVAMVNLDKCPQIMEFAAKHKLESPYHAQNPFQHRVHDIVTKYGKQMIVWDGANHPKPLPKDVIFMPWQSETPVAAELVQQGYRVINAPWGVRSPYMDPYQCNGAKLKSGEPKLIGATAILWEAPETSAIPFLRNLGALRNEPTYNPFNNPGHVDFVRRLAITDRLVDRILYGFSLAGDGLIDPAVFMRLNTSFTDRATLSLEAAAPAGQIHYTLDGSEPTASSKTYTAPVVLNESCTVKVRRIDPATKEAGPIYVKEYRRTPFVKHAAIGAKITSKPELQGSYAGGGLRSLVDGYLSEGDDYTAAGWAGWLRANLEIDIDLGKSMPIERVGGRFARGKFGLDLPKTVEFLVSEDGDNYRSLGTIDEKAAGKERGWYSTTPSGVTARYIRVKTTSGAEWMFVDEIAVNYTPLPPTLQHEALGKAITLAEPPSESYNLPGIPALTDGYIARSTDFANPFWLGVEGKDIEATIDMGAVTEIRKVGVHTLRYVPAGIYYPGLVEVLVSEDGAKFERVGEIKAPPDDRPEAMARMEFDLNGVQARYVKVITHQQTWWTFLDEVYVNPK